VSRTQIFPVPLGLFTDPGGSAEKYPGLVVRAPYVVCAYLVRHRQATVLFDTGIVGDAEAVARYAPRCLDLDEQLAALGVSRGEVDMVANCHLHADHAGGNHLFPGVPILVQSAELAAADAADYTVRAAAVDFPRADIRTIAGRHEVLPGMWLVPTPGHSPGHQSLLVDDTNEGTVLLAGQAFDDASTFASAVLAEQLRADASDVTRPDWIAELMAQDIDVARFAHDLAEWRPSPAVFTGTEPVPPWNQAPNSPGDQAR
jgi:N-acyl homoserine lactone hydrolase